ncbi:MAG: DUF3088 family protein [Cytophagia bacterium]|nr:DUF3088 family protein [Cytophagia bacterium]
MKPKLFLLHPDFTDLLMDNKGLKYYCPHCAFIEGVLAYYPKLRNEVDIEYVDFPRPRNKIIALLGEYNQSCPLLIIDAETADQFIRVEFKQHSVYLFSNETRVIASYFAKAFGIGIEHP